VIVRGQLGFDYNDEVVLIRLVLVNPDTREVFTHNLENLKLMYNTSIVPAEKWFGFSPDGKYLVNMGRYNLNDCWEVRDPLSLQSLGSEFVEYHMTPPAFSPDNTFMASIDGSDANAITVHTLPDARTFLTLKGGRMRAMVFSPDSRFLIYYNDEYTQEFGRQKALKIRDLYKKYSATLYNPKHDVSSLALTPDGRFLIIGLDDYVGYTEVLKMDLNTLEIVDRCQVSGVTGIHFSPDRSLMGLTYDDRSSYSALIVTLDGFKTVSKIPVGLFHEFAFSPDGKYALTLRHRIRIHDIFSTDEVYKSQDSPSFNVTSFYPDQRYVFLGPWIDRTYLDIPIPELSELLMEE